MTGEAGDRRRGVRLQKFLSRAGVASRREGERLILEGRVSVDGTVVTELGTRVAPDTQDVCVDGVRVALRPVRWVAMYKPAGYLTARVDDRGRPTVYSLLREDQGELFHVGRLDWMTEGLLLFTNDGETANRLLHPSYRIPRRYRAVVDGEAGAEEKRRLQRGVRLEDGLARAEDVRISARPSRSGPRGAVETEIRLTLREGRKREVRRMLEALDLSVKRLIRTSFGPVELGSLKPGEWRAISPGEVRELRAVVNVREPDGDT
jgi:23S rRNA pseudouridine2605 synthase